MRLRSQGLIDSDEDDVIEPNYPTQTPRRVINQTDYRRNGNQADHNRSDYDSAVRAPVNPRTPGRNTQDQYGPPSDDDFLMDDVRPSLPTSKGYPVSSSLPFDFRHESSDGTSAKPSLSVNDMYKRIKQLEQVQKDFDALVRLRFTEPEEIYKRYEAATSQQLKDADNYIKDMEERLAEKDEEIAQLREQLHTAKNDTSQAKEKQQLIMQNERLSAELALLRQSDNSSTRNLAQIKYMFEELTGLLISYVKVTPEGESYNCVQTGKHGTIQFNLVKSTESPDELRYIPLLDRKREAELISKLPEYLVNEILFSKDKANVFHLRLRNALNQ
ncbi:chromosome segregation protein Csm1/Pcs1-domain-containing protein [Dichotomocladium elegans]|nr:chromosome segregation protein Csm1/Pcs1-domain-containing protein [Dichotomocladium elegans]